MARERSVENGECTVARFYRRVWRSFPDEGKFFGCYRLFSYTLVLLRIYNTPLYSFLSCYFPEKTFMPF